jgi:hypothetical protein
MAERRHHAFEDRDLSMSRERRTIPLMREMSAAAKDCPLAPPEHASVYARTLHRACLVLGGIEPLAKHLEASDADLRRWLRGEAQPPERIFLAAVEIVLLHAGSAGRAN